MINPADMTWTCHVCGEERPDDKIDVLSSEIFQSRHPRTPITQNVRYCNDRPSCIEGAKVRRFIPE